MKSSFKIILALFIVLTVYCYSQDHEINMKEESLLGKECPELNCEKFINGKADLKSKPKLIYFMHDPSMEEMMDDETKKALLKTTKYINEIYDTLANKKIKVEIIGVANPNDEFVADENEFLKYIKANNIKYVIGVDKINKKGHQLSAIAFKRGVVPYLFLVNKENKIILEGNPLKIELEKIIKTLQESK